MGEPARSDPTFWRAPPKGEALPWSWARERLEAAREYWLATVGAGGRPAVRPLWGIWLDDRLVLSVGSTTVWRHVAANPRVSVTLGDAAEVVIVDGSAAPEHDGGVIGRMIVPYNEKYDWNFTPETVGGVITVQPDVVIAWVSGPPDVNAQSTFPLASSRWRF